MDGMLQMIINFLQIIFIRNCVCWFIALFTLVIYCCLLPKLIRTFRAESVFHILYPNVLPRQQKSYYLMVLTQFSHALWE